MEYDRLKKRYFLELQEQLAKSERRHAEEIEQLSQQLAYQIQYNNTLLEHLQQLEQQQQQAQAVVIEAKRLLAKTAEERDHAIDTCEKLQVEKQESFSKLHIARQEIDEQVEENKRLSFDNLLFRDELVKVKEDIAKYKFQLESSDKESDIQELNGDDTETGAHAEALALEVDALRAQLSQLALSASFERDRVEVLDLQLKKERSALTATLGALKEEQDKHHAVRDENVKLGSQLAARDNEAKSLTLDVDFLQNELKTSHKQAANYALERDERGTMCDALTTHTNKLQDKISSLEGDLDKIYKEAELQRESYENEIQQLHDDNAQIVSDIHNNAQNHQAELAQKAQEAEEMKHNYEESMREYCATLTQQCAGIQATLQEELRRILADKTSIVQAAREEKVNLDAHIALLSSRLNTSETLARESEIKFKTESDALKRERDWLTSKLSDLQDSSLENYSNFEEELRECKDLCVTLMSQYNSLLSSVAPLPSVIQSMCNDQNSQTEVSLGQIQLLTQQYSNITHQMDKLNDEKQMLSVLLEEEKSKSIMLQDSNATVQRMLQAAQGQAALAQSLSEVVDSKGQEITSLQHNLLALQDDLQQQRVASSSLLAKLDVAHCQIQIVNEENERSLGAFAETTMQHSHQVAELEDKIKTLQAAHQSSQAQKDAALSEAEGLRGQQEALKATQATQLAKAASDAGALEGQVKELTGQVQELHKAKAQAQELQMKMIEGEQKVAQAQGSVITLQEQRKQLQSENIELKEELEHLYKHQQLLTSLQQQQQHSVASRSEPKLDSSILEALKKQNRLIEDKCRSLQDNSMKMMKDFALQSMSPTPQSPDLSGS